MKAPTVSWPRQRALEAARELRVDQLYPFALALQPFEHCPPISSEGTT